MASFAVIVAGLAWALSYLSQDSEAVIVFGLGLSLVTVFGSYYGGDKLVLLTTGAKEIPKEADPELYRVVENLAITAGIPMPRVYVIPDIALNAFATGRDPEHASVAITAGLRRRLNHAELEAVMGHELSHIKNYDIRLMLLAAVLCGMIIFITRIFWRSGLGLTSNRERRGGGNPIVLIAAVVGIITAPIAAQLIKLAISRRREYLADASSVMLTRYPEAMISALEKIAEYPQVAGSNEATAHLFIYSPLQEDSLLTALFSTHPPLHERIAALKQGAHLA